VILLRVHLLDVLESLGCLLLADNRFPLAILDVAHYLLVGGSLLLILLALLTELKLEELLFLLGDSLILLPSLAGHLKSLFGSFGLLLELSDPFTAASRLFLLIHFQSLNLVGIFAFQGIELLLSVLQLRSKLGDLLSTMSLRVFPLA
jgi:hypothetical protein